MEFWSQGLGGGHPTEFCGEWFIKKIFYRKTFAGRLNKVAWRRQWAKCKEDEGLQPISPFQGETKRGFPQVETSFRPLL